METYQTVLLAVVWIGATAGIIGGLFMINYRSGWVSLKPYGIAVLIVSILGGIIGHFLVNVALAIPFILLNNGDILESLRGNKESAVDSSLSNSACNSK
jgi:hypothetical protein